MKKILWIIFAAAFVFRLLLIPVAYHGDLNNNISWGNALIKYGPVGYYEQKSWEFSAPNQPPVYIFLFGLTSFIYQTINNWSRWANNTIGIFPSGFIWWWERWGMTYLVKLPSIFADLGVGFLIYKFFERKNKKETGVKLAILWFINPLTWYNSAIWGQTDPIVNFLGLASILYLIDKKLVLSISYFVVSILFKPSLAIFSPMILVLVILQKYPLKDWIKSIVSSGVLVILVSFAFHPEFDLPIWLFNLYTQRFLPGEIGYLTANAFNFWYLVNPGKVLDAAIYFGLPARIWGYLITILGLLFTIFFLFRKKISETKFFYSLALIALITFLFMTRIHERYLYPFFPVATILVGLESIFLIPYLILSAVFLLNMYNLFWAPSIPFLENFMPNSQLPMILASTNLIIFAIYLFLAKRVKTKL